MPFKLRHIAPFSAIVLLAAACGGAVDNELDADPTIDENEAALTSPIPDEAANDPDGDEDRDCKDGDRHGHKRHRQHRLHVLDRLDGNQDHAITIASLPAGLPARLIARLHELDANGDGVVTRDEVKGPHRRRKHDKGRGDHDGDGHHDRGDHHD